MTLPRRTALALLAIPFIAGSASAQRNRDLYGEQPPPGSAFLRFVNAAAASVAVRPDFLPMVTLGTDGATRIGRYGTVTDARGRTFRVTVRAEDGATGQASLRAEPGTYVTVLLRPREGALEVVAIPDGDRFDQSRALLSFYNAVPGCPEATLGLEGGGAVFPGVPTGEVRRRAVPPVTASLVATCGAEETAPFSLSGMEAGGRYSAWLLPGPTGPQGFVTRDPVPGGWQPGR